MTVLNSPLLWTASLLLMDFYIYIYIYKKRVYGAGGWDTHGISNRLHPWDC